MDNEDHPKERCFEEARFTVSRRRLLGGMLAAAAAPTVFARAWAQPGLDAKRASAVQPQALRAFTEATGTPVPRYQHAAAPLADGRILIIGGWRHTGLAAYVPPLASVQIYDPAANTWTEAASLKTACAQHAAVALADGRILVTGGANHATLASTEIYSPISNTWTAAASLPQALYGHAAALAAGGIVLVSGGFNQEPKASLYLYDAGADAWQTA